MFERNLSHITSNLARVIHNEDSVAISCIQNWSYRHRQITFLDSSIMRADKLLKERKVNCNKNVFDRNLSQIMSSRVVHKADSVAVSCIQSWSYLIIRIHFTYSVLSNS